jgi:hypothetical protein
MRRASVRALAGRGFYGRDLAERPGGGTLRRKVTAIRSLPRPGPDLPALRQVLRLEPLRYAPHSVHA